MKWSVKLILMNRLSTEERAQILHLLCEGQSIRAVTRFTGASKNTVSKLLIDAGEAARAVARGSSETRECLARVGIAGVGPIVVL